MRQLLIILSFWCFSQPLFGQQEQIDSLKNVLIDIPSSPERAKILHSLVLKLYAFSKFEDSKQYFYELKQLSKNYGLYDIESDVLTGLSDIHLQEMNLDSSIHYSKLALRKIEYFNVENKIDTYTSFARYYDRKRMQDSAIFYMEKIFQIEGFASVGKKACLALSNTGAFYGNAKDNLTAMNYYLKAVDCADKHEAHSVHCFSLMYIGDAYMQMEEYEKANSYLHEALNIAVQHLTPNYIAGVQRTIGINKSRSGEYREAIEWNNKAIENYKKVNNLLYIYDVTSNSGVAYHKDRQYSKAIAEHRKALQIANEINNQMAIDGSRTNLVGAYIEMGRISEADNLLTNIIADTILYNKNLPNWLKSGIYEGKFKISERKGLDKDALKYFKLFSSFMDSLEKKEKSKDIAALEIKYQTEKKEKENLALKAETAEKEALLAQTTKRNWQLGGGLATAVIGLGIFFIAYRKNNRQKIEIERQKNKVEHLQKELHHRLKNNLAFIDVFIALAKDKFTDPRYQQKLTELQNRIKSMFEVHEQLFHHEHIASVNAASYISRLAENVKSAYANPNIKIHQDINPNDEVDSHISFPIGIIVNEFITNSYKYAFTPEKSGVITISLKETNKQYQLTLKDNGKGLPQNFDIRHIGTFGLDSIKLLTEEYDGSFSLKGEKGVTLNITLPKKAA